MNRRFVSRIKQNSAPDADAPNPVHVGNEVFVARVDVGLDDHSGGYRAVQRLE